ncbi:MAG: winged helix-turn-helix domain-containing protein [Aromatoleum sp.]|nr:winged helix-turn-helix domain-containing protein [Aromatoleum sp.]
MIDSALSAMRRRAIARTLFAPRSLEDAVRALGFVQMDPIRAPARAQDLILRHRVAGYRAGDLDRAYPRLPLAEDHLHVYGVIPIDSRRFLHPRVRAYRWRVEEEHPRLAAKIRAHIERNGATHPRDLQRALGKTRIANGWGGHSAATTRMLEALHYRGVLRVAHRVGGIRVYEIAPPPSGRPLAPATRARAIIELLVDLYAPLSAGSLRQLARMVTESSIAAPERERALARLLAGRTLAREKVDGVEYVWPASARAEDAVDDVVRLLAPFDPLVWDRRRFEHLWGWAYRLEAYTPPAKRVFGYYALPMLWRDDVIGWANANLAAGRLDVELAFVRSRPRSAAFRRALDGELARLAAAVGASTVRSVERP